MYKPLGFINFSGWGPVAEQKRGDRVCFLASPTNMHEYARNLT